MGKWHEIRCDYLCDDPNDLFWRVDAWETDDDDEEGKTIAYIDDVTGRVLYIDPVARVDEAAQEVISEKLKSLTHTLKVGRNAAAISVSMETKLGTLSAEFEPDVLTGANDDRIYIGFEPKEAPDEYVDLESVEVNENGIMMYVWNNLSDEDWQKDFAISKSDIEEFVAAQSGLPKRVEYTMDDLGITRLPADPEDLADIVGDRLSDDYGFCHKGFAMAVYDDKVIANDIEWDTED